MSETTLQMFGYAVLFSTMVVPLLIQWREGRSRTARNQSESSKLASETMQIDTETIQLLKTQVNELVIEVEKMRRNYRSLWSYMIMLVDAMQTSGITPPTPPAEFKSDPELVRFFKTPNPPDRKQDHQKSDGD